MTFLELCVFASAQIGSAQKKPWTTPTGTSGQTDQENEVVNWVQMAYKAIQIEQDWWNWRIKQGTFNLTIGQNVYTKVNIVAQVADYEEMAQLHFINDQRYFLVWDPAVGVGDQTFCFYFTYQDYRGWLDRSVIPNGKPQRFTFLENESLSMTPNPDKAYRIGFDYRIAIDTLSGDSDTPLMPARYHEAIAWGAVRYWAQQRESQAKYQLADREWGRIMNAMRRNQLPEIMPYAQEYYGR